MMTFLTKSLNTTDKKIFLIGGGRIASQKIGFMEQFYIQYFGRISGH